MLELAQPNLLLRHQNHRNLTPRSQRLTMKSDSIDFYFALPAKNFCAPIK
jgi:hypothetical protein